MALTTLSDLIQRTEFQALAINTSIEKSALWQSGIVRTDGELTRLAQLNTGNLFEFGYFNDLADTTENLSSDDCGVSSTCNNITTSKEMAIKLMRNQCWGAANVTYGLSATGDPMAAIASRIGDYWARRFDDAVISVVKGIVADNVANNASDMVHTAAATMTLNDIIDAKQTLGDMSDDLSIVVTHSSAAAALIKEGVSNRFFDDDGRLIYADVAGLRIVTSDKVPSSLGVFDAYLFAPNSIGWGWGRAKKPEELDERPSGGNGEGCETIHSRRHFVIHPYGFNFNNAAVAATNPINATNTELEDPLNWTRVKERKNVKIAVLRHT